MWTDIISLCPITTRLSFFVMRAKAIRHGNIEVEDDSWIAFLVALTDLDRRRG